MENNTESKETLRLTNDMYVSNEVINKIRTELSKKFFIVINYHSQYAEGITGCNRYRLIHIGDGTGFSKKMDARKVYSQLKKDGYFKTKVTQKDRGYGALGDFYSKPDILSGLELVERLTEKTCIYPTNKFI